MDPKMKCLSEYLDELKFSQEKQGSIAMKRIPSFCERLESNDHPFRSLKEEASRSTFLPSFKHAPFEEKTPPVKVAFSETSGRYLEASRDIEAGETLYKEHPLVMAPKGGSGPCCLACFAPFTNANWPVCVNCSAPKCVSCDGVYHSQLECEILKNIFSRNVGKERDKQFITLINIALTPIRTWIVTKEQPFLVEVVQSLQSNSEQRKQTPIGKFINNFVVNFFQRDTDLGFSSEYVHHVCGVFDTNAFEINQEDRQSRALLPVSSLMNHSCIPNAQHWFQDDQCIVRASCFIKKGEPVTNSYTQSLCSTVTRVSHLLLTKLFTCCCPRCLDPTEFGTHLSSIICPECVRGYLVPPKPTSQPWMCNECHYEASSSVVHNIVRASSMIMSRAASMDSPSLLEAIGKLSILTGKQHYTTVWLQFTFARNIAKAPSKASDEELVQALQILIFLKEIVGKLEPGITRLRGMLLSEQLKLQLEFLSRKQNGEEANFDHPILIASILEDAEGEAEECEVIMKYDPILEDVQLARRELNALLTKELSIR